MSVLIIDEAESLDRMITTYLRGDEAQRIFVFVMGGPTGAELDDFLTTNGYEFGALANDPELIRTVAASQTAMDAVAASQVAMDTVVASQVAMDAVAASETARESLLSSPLLVSEVRAGQLSSNFASVINGPCIICQVIPTDGSSLSNTSEYIEFRTSRFGSSVIQQVAVFDINQRLDAPYFDSFSPDVEMRYTGGILNNQQWRFEFIPISN